MRERVRMPKWPVCAVMAAAAACADPSETNAVSDANAAGDAAASAVSNGTADARDSSPDNTGASAGPGSKAAPGAAAAPAPISSGESYAALGQEPGWVLKIAGGRIDYTGNYGAKKIDVGRPDPEPMPNGRRYATPRLTVNITYTRCNDGMSGFGFEHQVTIVADGETYTGCGGVRKPEWDM